MDSLKIQGNHEVPDVSFESFGLLQISGKSLPEDANEFYMPLRNWVTEYAKQPAKECNDDGCC